MSFKLNPEFTRKLEELSKPKSVSLPELMPAEFMRANTSFGSIQEMFDKSPISDAQQEDVPKLLQSEAWNAYVRANTNFENWQEMVKKAGTENIKKRWNA